MKTMTCQQLGGPCDVAHTGSDADEVIKAQDQHLKDAVAAGDTEHAPAAAMRARWRHPIRGMSWYKATKNAFAELPAS